MANARFLFECYKQCHANGPFNSICTMECEKPVVVDNATLSCIVSRAVPNILFVFYSVRIVGRILCIRIRPNSRAYTKYE